MNIEELEAITEGLLFASGESVSVKRLCEVTETDEKTMTGLLRLMETKYENDPSRGIRIIKLEDSYQLCTKREYYDYVKTLRDKKRRASLSNAGLEVLSVIAYNQPVTRSALEFIRGVNSDGALNNLIAAGLVEEVGRLDAPGKPMLFGTTEEFLRCFNLTSLADLPDVEAEYNFAGLNNELANEGHETEEKDENTNVSDFEIEKFDDENG